MSGTERGGGRFGAQLAAHRARAGYSQLRLAHAADVSPRHLGFLELGRSRPSADMVRRLADVLALTRGERDELLLAAGFAPERPPEALAGAAQAMGAAAFGAVVAMTDAPTPERVVQIAAGPLAALGIGHFISGVIRRTPRRLIVERDADGRPAVGWLRHMDLRGHHERDYLVTAAFGADRAFSWDELPRPAMRPDQRRILDEAADFRIGTGFVVPVRRADGTVRAFSGWAEKLDPDPATRTAASLLAVGLMEALDRLGSDRAVHSPSRLLPAHREALLRLADSHLQEAKRPARAMPCDALLAQAAAAMGSACPVAAASRAYALGLLD